MGKPNQDLLKLALEKFNKAIEIKHDYTDAFFNRGLVNHSLGNTDAALENYREAIRLDPNDSEAYYKYANLKLEIAEIKRQKGEIDEANKLEQEAKEYWQKAVELVRQEKANHFQGCNQ